jgi:hypothetical protein
VEYLRVGGIFRGNIPPTFSSKAKNAGGENPISPSPLEELGGIFYHIIKLEYLNLYFSVLK